MHYQVTGQRIICGGYQLFTASGFGKTEHEAIADALATHPDRAAWQPHELRAESDPINLPTVESGLNLPIRSRHHLHHAATKTATRGAIVVGIALAIESAPKAADGGQSISPRTMGLDQTTGPAWVVIGANDPSPRRITGSARGESIFTRSDEALAGQSIHTAEVTHKNPLTQVDGVNPGWVASGPRESISAGFSEMSPVTVATRAGRGMDARKEPFASEFESLPVKTAGPAETISVASRKDETRSLVVAARSSLGLQPHEGNDGAVGNLGTDHSWQLPPTEFNVHPSTGFSSPAGVPSRVGGVGNGNATANDTPHPRAIAGGGAILGVQTGELKPAEEIVYFFSESGARLWAVSASQMNCTYSGFFFSPAVGGNRTDLHAKRELREETGHQVPVLTRTRLTVNRQPEQSALSDRPGGMPGTFSAHRLAWLAKAFAVSSVILTGIAAISAVMLAGRLEEE